MAYRSEEKEGAVKLSALFSNLEKNTGSREITSITCDSRSVVPGSLFAAFSGAETDGYNYIGNAIDKGAVAVLTDRIIPSSLKEKGVVEILSSLPRKDYALAASKFWSKQPPKIAAVTGTNGKSSVVDFLRQIWKSIGYNSSSVGTLGIITESGLKNLQHTTPDATRLRQTFSQLANENVTHCAVEASSHGLEQYRLDGTILSAGAFTNLTRDHLDYHDSFDSYRNAKKRLFTELLSQNSIAIVCADSGEDSENFLQVAENRKLRTLSYGWKGRDLKLKELMPKRSSQKATVFWQGSDYSVEIPLIGEFQVLNALCAGGIALGMNEDWESVKAGLESLRPVSGRLEFVGKSEVGTQIYVDYAHTPDGLDTVLRSVRPHTKGKLAVVFGCGGDRDTGKRMRMGEIASRYSEGIIVTDDNPRTENPASIRAEIIKGCPNATEIGDRREAIAHALNHLDKNDTLLIAGKGHETGQIIGNEVIPYSDQEVVLNLIGNL